MQSPNWIKTQGIPFRGCQSLCWTKVMGRTTNWAPRKTGSCIYRKTTSIGEAWSRSCRVFKWSHTIGWDTKQNCNKYFKNRGHENQLKEKRVWIIKILQKKKSEPRPEEEEDDDINLDETWQMAQTNMTNREYFKDLFQYRKTKGRSTMLPLLSDSKGCFRQCGIPAVVTAHFVPADGNNDLKQLYWWSLLRSTERHGVGEERRIQDGWWWPWGCTISQMMVSS